MTKPYFLLFIIAVLSFGLSAQDTTTPEGRWHTIDDATGEVKSVVEIYREGSTFSGKIAEIMNPDRKNAVCEKCSGKQKDAPIEGLVIIKNLKSSGDLWKSGTILDPEKGSEYKLSVWYEDDPNILFIRGKHWTGLYRTQEWKRAK